MHKLIPNADSLSATARDVARAKITLAVRAARERANWYDNVVRHWRNVGATRRGVSDFDE